MRASISQKETPLVLAHKALKEKRFSDAFQISKKFSNSGTGMENLLFSRIACSPACGKITFRKAIEILLKGALTGSPEALRIIGFLLFSTPNKKPLLFGKELLWHAAKLKEPVALEFLKLRPFSYRPLRKNWKETLLEFHEKSPELFKMHKPFSRQKTELVSRKPYIRLVRNFLNELETEYILASSVKRMGPAVVYTEEGKTIIQKKNRSSKNFVFWPEFYDPVLFLIDQRIARLTKTKITHGEPLVTNLYQKGDQFSPHYDFFPPNSDRVQKEGQRIWTFIIYLNDDYKGGRTAFYKPKIGIKGNKGDAIVFRNVTPDGAGDPETVHGGMEVKKGKKWIVTKGIRDKNFYLAQEGNKRKK